MGKLTVVLTLMILSVTALAQVNLSANNSETIHVKNAYSLGQASASQLGIRSTYANDQQNPVMLTAVNKLDALIQQRAHSLGVDSQQVMNVLKGIDPKSQEANPLKSQAALTIQNDLKAHGLSDHVVKAFDLGWKTSAYSQTCALALSIQDRNPGFRANFLGAYPEMIHQLKIDATDLGMQIRSPQGGGLSLADTCKELNSTVTSLNNSLQIH